jgi:GH25 family lysozyme M1 (1,4-beta-N-acetylmuramidase)
VLQAKNIALVAMVAMVACLPVAVFAPPASAAAEEASITHPQDDWAGSQIAKHEGVGAPQGATFIPSGTGSPDGTNPGDADPGDADPAATAVTLPGFDVSGHQGNVNWPTAAKTGGRFAYIKATEGSTYVNPYFAQQYNGAYSVGMIRGAYHFATPNTSSGIAQADHFVSKGGSWSADGRTLPPALDLEYNPYGATCYGMTPAALVAWTRAFVNEVHLKTTRYPTIYTSTSWWSQCMGRNASFGADPLWIARYNKTLGALPPGWKSYAIWQYTDAGALPGDQDTYNGSADQLGALAHG